MEYRKSTKGVYLTPSIEKIKLDNEISLSLASLPPVGPGNGYLMKPEYLNNDWDKILLKNPETL